jgi:predicted nucleotidyltransferase
MERTVSIGIPEMVKGVVDSIDNRAKVILFGSRARGDYRSDSDWDFLIILPDKVSDTLEDRIRNLLYEVELDTDEVITSIIENEQNWIAQEETPFYKNVGKEGLEI